MRWQRGPLKVVILTKMMTLTKIAKNLQSLTCKSDEEAKGTPPPPPKKGSENGEKSQRRFWRRWQICRKWLKLAKALDRSNEIDEFGGHGQRVNLSKKLPEGWRKFKWVYKRHSPYSREVDKNGKSHENGEFGLNFPWHCKIFKLDYYFLHFSQLYQNRSCGGRPRTR